MNESDNRILSQEKSAFGWKPISERRLDSLRYHAVGKAVTPQVAEWMAARIANALRNANSTMLRESAA